MTKSRLQINFCKLNHVTIIQSLIKMVIIKFDHFLVYGLLPGGGRQKSETAGEPHLQILGRRQQQAGEQPKVAEPDEQEPFQRI